MFADEKKLKKDAYFHLPQEDRIEFELEEKEKREKENATDNVFKELNKKK